MWTKSVRGRLIATFQRGQCKSPIVENHSVVGSGPAIIEIKTVKCFRNYFLYGRFLFNRLIREETGNLAILFLGLCSIS